MRNTQNITRGSILWGTVGILLWVSAGFLQQPCWGFTSSQRQDKAKAAYTDRGRSFALRPGAGKAAVKYRVGEWERFTQHYGGQWKIRWNETTGTPARIVGPGIATGLDAQAADGTVKAWAADFVDRNSELLGVGSGDLELLDLRRAGRRTYITFRQIHEGIPVYNSVLKMNLDERGRLTLLSSSCFPNVACRGKEKLSPEQAARIAAGRIAEPQGKRFENKFFLREAQKVIFPMPAGSWDSFRLCYRLEIHLEEPLGDWVVVIDAARGIEYVRYNNYRFGSVAGEVSGYVLPSYYDDAPVLTDFADEDIHVFEPTPVYSWPLTTDPGWSTEGSWAWGTPNGVGGDQEDPAPTAGHTGSTCYAYGLTGGYENNLGAPWYLTTAAINCSALTGTHLSFWRWVGVEASYYDHATVQVSNDGTTWTLVWENPLLMSTLSYQWERVIYDISSIADGQSTVYIRWGMGPTDSSYTFAGWYLDDVEIYANGGSTTTSDTGSYSVSYAGTGNAEVYAQMSGPYQDVYYEGGRRLAYDHTVPSGAHSWSWVIPSLSTLRTWDLSTNPGWTTQGAWAWGIPQGNEGDPSSGYTGSSVYGYNLAGAYPNDIDPAHYLTTPAIDCSLYQGTHLRFWRWLGVEYFDYATIEVSNNGTDWVWVYVNMGYPADEDTAWTQVTYDISAVADGRSTVYIRWGLLSDYSVTYCGWNLDDIEILADTSGSPVRPGVYDYDEVNVFHHMTVAHNSIKTIEPAFTAMDYRVPAYVRVGINYANAFWDGVGVNFGEGDGVGTRNLALFSDVIYHEYNHGITHQIYPYFLLPYEDESGALDEAWSDYFACNITDEPLIGEGDLIIGEPWMRNLDNTLRVPDDWVGEVHDDGRIMGGALWDLREALGPVVASALIHFARYNLAETFFDYYEDVLLTDDTNSNLDDGTPNMLAIAEAFGAHGIGGLQVLNITQQVTAPVVDNGKLDAGEIGDLFLRLKAYVLADGVQAVLETSDPYLTILDDASAYGGFSYGQEKESPSDPLTLSIIPECPEDQILHATLSLTASGGYSTGQTLTLINAPDQIVYDDGEVNRYFGYGAPGGGFAVRFTPPFYPLTISSVRLWPFSESAGVAIDLCAWDDDGPEGSPGTELMAPKTVAVAGSDTWEEFLLGQLNFRTAYEWNLDSNPGWSAEGGWAFGVPTGSGGSYGYPDPTSGATGSNVYGYNLAGDYPNSLSSTQYLTAGPINCSGLKRVHLRFQRWLGVEEPVYDHASLEVSNDGSTWSSVWENTTEVTDSAWTQVTYDISAVADGQSAVYVRWGMGPTDSSWTYCGWNIDDIQILEAISTSGGIRVTEGDIYLGWTEPSETYYNGVTTRNLDQRSWAYSPVLGWFRLDTEGYMMDMMVRARYSILSTPTGVTDWAGYQ